MSSAVSNGSSTKRGESAHDVVHSKAPAAGSSSARSSGKKAGQASLNHPLVSGLRPAEKTQFSIVKEFKPEWDVDEVLKFCQRLNFDSSAIEQEIASAFEFDRPAHQPTAEEWQTVSNKPPVAQNGATKPFQGPKGPKGPKADKGKDKEKDRPKSASPTAKDEKPNKDKKEKKAKTESAHSEKDAAEAASDSAAAAASSVAAPAPAKKGKKGKKEDDVPQFATPVVGLSYAASLLKAQKELQAKEQAAKDAAAAKEAEAQKARLASIAAAQGAKPAAANGTQPAQSQSQPQTPAADAAKPAAPTAAQIVGTKDPKSARFAAHKAQKPQNAEKKSDAAEKTEKSEQKTPESAAATASESAQPASSPAASSASATAPASSTTPATSAPDTASPSTPAASQSSQSSAPQSSSSPAPASAAAAVASSTPKEEKKGRWRKADKAEKAAAAEAKQADKPAESAASGSSSSQAAAAEKPAQTAAPAAAPASSAPSVVSELLSSAAPVLLPSHIQSVALEADVQFGVAGPKTGPKPKGPKAPAAAAAPAAAPAAAAQSVPAFSPSPSIGSTTSFPASSAQIPIGLSTSVASSARPAPVGTQPAAQAQTAPAAAPAAAAASYPAEAESQSSFSDAAAVNQDFSAAQDQLIGGLQAGQASATGYEQQDDQMQSYYPDQSNLFNGYMDPNSMYSYQNLDDSAYQIGNFQQYDQFRHQKPQGAQPNRGQQQQRQVQGQYRGAQQPNAQPQAQKAPIQGDKNAAQNMPKKFNQAVAPVQNAQPQVGQPGQGVQQPQRPPQQQNAKPNQPQNQNQRPPQVQSAYSASHDPYKPQSYPVQAAPGSASVGARPGPGFPQQPGVPQQPQYIPQQNAGYGQLYGGQQMPKSGPQGPHSPQSVYPIQSQAPPAKQSAVGPNANAAYPKNFQKQAASGYQYQHLAQPSIPQAGYYSGYGYAGMQSAYPPYYSQPSAYAPPGFRNQAYYPAPAAPTPFAYPSAAPYGATEFDYNAYPRSMDSSADYRGASAYAQNPGSQGPNDQSLSMPPAGSQEQGAANYGNSGSSQPGADQWGQQNLGKSKTVGAVGQDQSSYGSSGFGPMSIGSGSAPAQGGNGSSQGLSAPLAMGGYQPFQHQQAIYSQQDQGRYQQWTPNM